MRVVPYRREGGAAEGRVNVGVPGAVLASRPLPGARVTAGKGGASEDTRCVREAPTVQLVISAR